MNSYRFILLLPMAVLLRTSVGTCGAATAPSLSVVSLAELVSLQQRQAAVVWDAQGNAYVATTVSPGEVGISSPPLPVTPGAAQTQPGLGICSLVATGIIGTMQYYCTDAFILKQQPDGSLVYATYLGGDKQDTVGGIALDAAGNVYVTGTTGGDFPATPGALLTSMPPGVSSTGFVAKLNLSGNPLRLCYLSAGRRNGVGHHAGCSGQRICHRWNRGRRSLCGQVKLQRIRNCSTTRCCRGHPPGWPSPSTATTVST